MKIFKILKHDRTTHIHIINSSENHQYIMSMLGVTLMAHQHILADVVIPSIKFKSKVPNPITEITNVVLVDIILSPELSFPQKISLVAEYNEKVAEKLSSQPSTILIEEIDVITSVNILSESPFSVSTRDFRVAGVRVEPLIQLQKEQTHEPLKLPDRPSDIRRSKSDGGWKTCGGTNLDGWTTHAD